MSYQYLKAPPGYTLARPPSRFTRFRYLFSALLFTLGVAAFTSVIYPLLVYQLSYAPRFQSAAFKSPAALSPLSLASSPAPAAPTFLPEMINTALDYTDSSSWFPRAQSAASSPVFPASYLLSLPTLGIAQATVKTGSQDLKQSLIQYPGTALPGDLGNTVIFGHSVLPQFFNPTNYLTIFSTLHTLALGDKIELVYDGASYTYEIYDMYSVTPDDLSPLAQSYDDRRLTLITCTPPGTYLRRLIVRARLI